MPSRPAPRILTVLAAAALALVTLTACATPHSLDGAKASGVPTPTATSTAGSPGEDALVVRDASSELHLESTPEDLNDEDFASEPQATVSGDALYVFVRQPGWSLSADQFTGAGGVYSCSSWHAETRIDELGDGWWVVRPGEAAGTYKVYLSAASGPGLPLGGKQGESNALLEWETTADGPTRAEGGTVMVGGDADETPRLFVDVWNPPQGWTTASGTVTITGSSGDPVTVDLPYERPDCVGGSTVMFNVPLTDDVRRTLGAAPYAYDLTVTIDGVERHATVDDESGAADGFAFDR